MSATPDASPEASTRRDRAVIAAQACETCRARKSKCDERRPQCSLCTRLNVQCVYRVPQPTKKDKTLVHILQAVERVEAKLDRMHSPQPASSRPPFPSHSSSDVAEHDSTEATTADTANDTPDRQQKRRRTGNYLPSDSMTSNNHTTASHRLLIWPAVYLMLLNAQSPQAEDLQTLCETGSSWFNRMELNRSNHHLPTTPDPNVDSWQPSILASLSADHMRQLADAYFDTFNVLQPILDRSIFYSEVITAIRRGTPGPVDRSTTICLALSVFALGSVALEGCMGPPSEPSPDGRSGVRGGEREKPPGLALFNEARRQFGFSMHDCTLENIQIYLLHAQYFESCARHMDYWRACASASTAFQIFVKCRSIDWGSPSADMVKRVFWTCLLNEDTYHLEIDLPSTGIYSLEDQIPLPSFQPQTTHSAQNMDNGHYHFLAMIGLRRVVARIHLVIHEDAGAKAENPETTNALPISVVKELGRQLESWRTFLPQNLQWSDSEPHASVINPLGRNPPVPLFTADHSRSLGSYKQNLDVVTAQLRSRFYHARYLIYRPFIFKALHFGESMTQEDKAFCALSIKSMCLWPVIMRPCCDKKRLLPHLFLWTQNVIGILAVIRLAQDNVVLREICEERVNLEDLHSTARLALDWIRDVKSIDATAAWSWDFLEPLFTTMQ